MKSVTQYKCDVCGTLYADKGACADCEKQHRIPAEIVRADHRAKGVYACYPPHIIVRFDDGSERKYKREG